MTSILAANALTTYARAKARLTLHSTNAIDDSTHQNIVEALINSVSDGVVRYCGREFHKKARTETYAPPRGERLVVDVTPVASTPAPSATVDGASVTVEIEDANLGFLRVDGGWGGSEHEDEVANSVSLDTVPGTAERVAEVTYTAGYVTPAQEADLAVSQVPTSSTVQTLYSPQTAAKAGTLTVTTAAGTTKATVTAVWNDGTPSTLINAEEVATASLPKTYNLGDLDADLAGFFLVVTAAADDTASEVVYTVAATDGTRDLPWDLEEAVIAGVAMLWKAAIGGYAKDVMPELGDSGLPKQCELMLKPYRRNF